MTNDLVLITGAGGTVGSALFNELVRLSATVRLGFHSIERAEQACALGVDAVAIDFSDVATLRHALADVDAVFLLGTGILGQFERELNVVREARAAGVKRIVKLSAWQADLEGYAIARIHRAIERAIEDSGIAYTFLRPNAFMQNFVTHKSSQIRRGSLFEAAGETKISHIDVRDVAAVAARALLDERHSGRAYELSGPFAITYAEAADILTGVLGQRVEYIEISEVVARSAMIENALPSFYAEALMELHRYYCTGAGALVTDVVPRITGRPAISFEQFVADYRAMWR